MHKTWPVDSLCRAEKYSAVSDYLEANIVTDLSIVNWFSKHLFRSSRIIPIMFPVF